MTPFGGRLITEVVGCSSNDPAEVKDHRTEYYPGQYGYNKANAANKFIRMRVNNGILPLSTIRGGKCQGRNDGLCSLNNFLDSQKTAGTLANYQFSCFANYTLKNPLQAVDYDGAVNASSSAINVYPGQLTAEYIVQHIPAEYKWAIAGRTHKKLSALADELKELEPSRPQPGMQCM